jgi:16S rRNA (guanine(966)-N(2))-methyltransferase RsmD
MRIVSGEFKGRTIAPPSNFAARPTTDFAKVALFNILAVRFDFAELSALDLFSGTGSISYELASRGCHSVTSVELNAQHHAFIRRTAQALPLPQLRCIRANAFAYLRSCHEIYDLIFADPPYDLAGVEQIPQLVFERDLLKLGSWLIVEHGKEKNFSEHPHFREHRSYGNVNFSIFEKKN